MSYSLYQGKKWFGQVATVSGMMAVTLALENEPGMRATNRFLEDGKTDQPSVVADEIENALSGKTYDSSVRSTLEGMVHFLRKAKEGEVIISE